MFSEYQVSKCIILESSLFLFGFADLLENQRYLLVQVGYMGIVGSRGKH